MNAGEAVRLALLAAMQADGDLSVVAGLGVEPGSGSLPQVMIDPPAESDWGTKTARGREVRTAVTLRVAKGQRARMPALVDAVERCGEGLHGTVDGWSVGSAVLVRTRIVDGRDETRVAQIEHRIRVLEI